MPRVIAAKRKRRGFAQKITLEQAVEEPSVRPLIPFGRGDVFAPPVVSNYSSINKPPQRGKHRERYIKDDALDWTFAASQTKNTIPTTPVVENGTKGDVTAAHSAKKSTKPILKKRTTDELIRNEATTRRRRKRKRPISISEDITATTPTQPQQPPPQQEDSDKPINRQRAQPQREHKKRVKEVNTPQVNMNKLESQGGQTRQKDHRPTKLLEHDDDDESTISVEPQTQREVISFDFALEDFEGSRSEESIPGKCQLQDCLQSHEESTPPMELHTQPPQDFSVVTPAEEDSRPKQVKKLKVTPLRPPRSISEVVTYLIRQHGRPRPSPSATKSQCGPKDQVHETDDDDDDDDEEYAQSQNPALLFDDESLFC